MNDVLSQAALAISGAVFAGLWEGALIVAAVWLFLRVLPKLGASTRYAIWLTALIMLVVAPLCTVMLPAHHAAQAPGVVFNAAGVADLRAPVKERAIRASQAPDARALPAAPTNAPVPVAQHIDIPLDLSVTIAGLWLLACGLQITVLLVNLQKLSTLRRSAQILPDAFGYRVLASQHTAVPLAIGFTRPAVVLPSSFTEDLSDDALDAVVMHEVAHLCRYDVWTNALARVLQALLMLNPFAWFVFSRLSTEREIACDDWVVARLDAGELFANTLATMVCRPAFASIAAPSAIGSKHAVVARIERLLDRGPRRLRLSAVALTSVLLALTMFVTIVPPFSPVLAFASQGSPSSGASDCNHPAMIQLLNPMTGRPSGRWVTLKYDLVQGRNSQSTVLDVTIDAGGKLSRTAVVKTPHPRDGRAARRVFSLSTYRPAVAHCKAVASTTRVALLIDIAPPAPISVVRADYPNGWSSRNPGACKVPDLTHAGVPAVQLTTNKTVTASVLVHTNSSGKVTDANLTRSSGNAAYDNATLAVARNATYPLGENGKFKPVRPSGAPTYAWNAAHGYDSYSKCMPRPDEYTWTAMFPSADR